MKPECIVRAGKDKKKRKINGKEVEDFEIISEKKKVKKNTVSSNSIPTFVEEKRMTKDPREENIIF